MDFFLSVKHNAENVAVEKKKWHSDFPQCRVMSSTESPLLVTVETSNVQKRSNMSKSQCSEAVEMVNSTVSR